MARPALPADRSASTSYPLFGHFWEWLRGIPVKRAWSSLPRSNTIACRWLLVVLLLAVSGIAMAEPNKSTRPTASTTGPSTVSDAALRSALGLRVKLRTLGGNSPEGLLRALTPTAAYLYTEVDGTPEENPVPRLAIVSLQLLEAPPDREAERRRQLINPARIERGVGIGLTAAGWGLLMVSGVFFLSAAMGASEDMDGCRPGMACYTWERDRKVGWGLLAAGATVALTGIPLWIDGHRRVKAIRGRFASVAGSSSTSFAFLLEGAF